MGPIQTIILGVAAGYAATIWAIVGVTAARLGRWWSASAYAILGLSNLLIAYIVTAGILGRQIELPPWVSLLILLIILDLPALRELRSWRSSQTIIRNTLDE